MKTTKEKIEIMQVYENGADIEFRKKSKDNKPWSTLHANSHVTWDWYRLEYRIRPEPKKRLMTIKELWEKTLIHKKGHMSVVNKASNNNIQLIRDSFFYSIEEIHADDWRLAGPDLDYETATSLEVEE